MLGKTKMFKAPNKYFLLFLVLAFSFAYRVLLLHWETYPPGADIGLHESVINSITLSGNTNFLWNNYHMGGGLSLTFPGYHIFVSYIMLMTRLPDYLAHSMVAAFFSSFIVLCAFLIGRRVWGESTAFIVALLVAISRFDVEMLLWGGFPNAVTLLLIPVVFYLYSERERFSRVPFFVATTFLSGAIFLTHSLSAIMFVCIVFFTVIIAIIVSKRLGVSKKNSLTWLFPILLGALLVSPFLVEAVPVYLVAGDVDDLAPGIYKYNPAKDELALVKEGDVRASLAAASLGQRSVADGAINIVMAAVYERTKVKYGSRGERYVHIEVGHAAQNICLEATALGLGLVTVGAFDDAEVAKTVGMSQDESPLYVIPVGRIN